MTTVVPPASRLTVRVRVGGGPPIEVPAQPRGITAAGPVIIEIEPQADGWSWSVHARTTPVAVDAVALVWSAGPAGDNSRLFANGYPSWAPSRTRALAAHGGVVMILRY